VPKDFTGEFNIIGENSDLKEPDAQAWFRIEQRR
jgi:hypothetical protein